MTDSAPSVYDFLSAIEFLRAYYDYRKSLNAEFSYERWADELQFGSRSLLRLILTGKRKITGPVIDLFCRSLFADEESRSYFCDLIILSQTKSREERLTTEKRISRRLRSEHSNLCKVPGDDVSIAEPLSLRCLSVLDSIQLDRTIEGLSAFFSVAKSEIQVVLDRLVQSQLVTCIDGKYELPDFSFRIDDKIDSAMLTRFHEKSLQDAIRAKDLAFELRRFRTSIALLSKEDFDFVLSQFDSLVKSVSERGLRRDSSLRRLFQINLNVHAVSNELIGSSDA